MFKYELIDTSLNINKINLVILVMFKYELIDTNLKFLLIDTY